MFVEVNRVILPLDTFKKRNLVSKNTPRGHRETNHSPQGLGVSWPPQWLSWVWSQHGSESLPQWWGHAGLRSGVPSWAFLCFALPVHRKQKSCLRTRAVHQLNSWILIETSKIMQKYNLNSLLWRKYISTLHAVFNAHLVSKAGPVISGNFHHVRDFTRSSIYNTNPLQIPHAVISWDRQTDR